MQIEEIDTQALVGHLVVVFRGSPPEGAVVGRTKIRDAVAERLACSQLEAEELVDTLVMRGLVVLVTRADGAKLWEFGG